MTLGLHHALETAPIHLGRGAAAVVHPPFTGMEWYAGYAARHGDDGDDGRLVSLHRFAESWTMWEMHPAGDEVVLCTEGTITLHQETADGTRCRVLLRTGDYAINPRGIWHTADTEGPCAALFITAGSGTVHRPR